MATALAVFVFSVVFASAATAQPGGTVTAPTEVAPGIPLAPNIFFELETVPGSLKEEPVWTELERMLNEPYAFVLSPVEGNAQGFPSYEATIQRRRSFLPPGCSYQVPVPAGLVACDDSLLPPFLVHPLNYNHMNGEELRLINAEYPGGPFHVPSHLVECGVGDPDEPAFCGVETMANSINGPVVSPANDPNRYVWVYEELEISPGEDRVEETSIDHNSPMRPDVDTPTTSFPASYGSTPVCMVTTELVPPEGSILCGGDPGIPGYAGFGVLDMESYSTPAVPGVFSPGTAVQPGGIHRLFDPTGCDERNEISPGSCIAPGYVNWLLRPTVRPTPSSTPDFLQNSLANLAIEGEDALVASNENDYILDRDAAVALGKAAFWDMQVGSDSVQACASCHFEAGADDRTKNQVNPNHLGGDLNFDVVGVNEELTEGHFPFATFENEITNDAASSMGVHWGVFDDIPPIGTFVQNGSGVEVLPPDIREANPLDPIPGFAGQTGNEFRRVEPRNTPTIISAAFNFDNFWDGRARHDFNGGSAFGPSDPQAHVFVQNELDELEATRQIVRNVSLASLATGPALSEFEMSLFGRNWAKIGKKLLQPRVTPLANQLVDPNDSVLGIYSNQGGSACVGGGPNGINGQDRSGSWQGGNPQLAPGKPGLCISYRGLIRRAFYQSLWSNATQHLEGCYTDGNVATHPNQCAAGSVAIPVLSGATLVDSATDPFDNYVLAIADGEADQQDTNQFKQMEANFSLFFGLSVNAWAEILIPDDSPFDHFFEANPDAFKNVGEAGETGLVWDLPSCTQSGGVQPCFTEVGPFKRTPGVPLNLETGPGTTDGTRQAGDPDPLLGMDIFYGFNLTGKNPDFRTTRCGECHAGATTTDHTMGISNQLSFGDFVAEFSLPGVEIPIEPLGRSRVISGFGLEGELAENAQDGIERRIINQSMFNPADGLTYPDGQAFFDNGMYNLGVTPCPADNLGPTGYCNDVGRGGLDAFGFPLSLARLMLMNMGGLGQVPEVPLSNFDPSLGPTGGLYEPTAQDQQINPGHEEEPAEPLLPPYLAPWASNTPVGDEVQQDEVGGGGAGMLNTFHEIPLLEGFVDTLGPFNPAGTVGENYNMAPEVLMGTWPTVNRIGFAGSFKAALLRNSELTPPYFHNGGKLTLMQVINFYAQGGDFPLTNAHHRDFNIMNLLQDEQALGGLSGTEQTERLVALVDFLLTLTDERVRNEQAPFDHPEIFVPLDGRAPDNSFGRPGLLTQTAGDCVVAGEGPCFEQIPAVGAGGGPPITGFLGVEAGDRNNPNCDSAMGPVSHYCSVVN